MRAIHQAMAGKRVGDVDLVIFQPGVAGLAVDTPDKGLVAHDVELATNGDADQYLMQAPGKVGALAIQHQRLFKSADKG